MSRYLNLENGRFFPDYLNLCSISRFMLSWYITTYISSLFLTSGSHFLLTYSSYLFSEYC
jgi:hypothetical protein